MKMHQTTVGTPQPRQPKAIALIGLDDIASVYGMATKRSLAVYYYITGMMHFMAETVAEEPYIFLTDLATDDIVYALKGYRLVFDKEIKVRCILPSQHDADELDEGAMDIWSRSQHGYGSYRDIIEGADCVLSFVHDLDASPAIQYAIHRNIAVCHYPPADVFQVGRSLLIGFLEDVVQPLGNLALNDSVQFNRAMLKYGLLDT